MSYCRFSSDNWKSDVYAWADYYGGYRVQVAANKPARPVPEVDWNLILTDFPKYIRLHRKQMAFLKRCKRKKIGLPYDGKGFHVETAAELLEIFLMLRKAGYHVPQSAIDAATQDSAEQTNQPTTK